MAWTKLLSGCTSSEIDCGVEEGLRFDSVVAATGSVSRLFRLLSSKSMYNQRGVMIQSVSSSSLSGFKLLVTG